MPQPRTRSPRLRYALGLGLSVLVLAALMVWSLGTGRFSVPADRLLHMLGVVLTDAPRTGAGPAEYTLLTTIRLPRLLAAALIGAALSLAGAAFQGIFRNPLVSPYLLGVSQGASVGAALAILMGLGAVGVQAWALATGLLAVGLATTIPRLLRNRSTLMLVLSGVIVGGFASAMVGFLQFIADPETQLAEIIFWQMGSLSRARPDNVLQLALVAVPCAVGLLLLRWRINILSLGDAEAKTLGVDLPRVRGITILLATLLTAASVCLAGSIAWVGLVIPHLCRLLVGADHAKLLPLSVTVGAAFMVLVDTLARSVDQTEIPLSVVTGFIGAPLYLILLIVGRVRIR